MWDESTNAPATAVAAAFHISMTKPLPARFHKKNTAVPGSAEGEEEWAAAIAGKTGKLDALKKLAKKKQIVLAIQNCDPDYNLRGQKSTPKEQEEEDALWSGLFLFFCDFQ